MQPTISKSVMRRLDELARDRSNLRCVQALLFDYAVIAAAVYLCIGVSWWFYPVSLLLIGSTQRAFTNLLHDATHTTLARSKWLNYLGGTVCSAHLVFHMFVPYKHSHIAGHHPHLGNPERDPDLMFHVECGLYQRDGSVWRFVLDNVVLPLFGSRSLRYVRYVFRDRILFRDEDRRIPTPLSFRTERTLMVGIWAVAVAGFATAGWLHYLVLLWIVPMFTVMLAIGWIVELAEHYPLPESENNPLFLTRNRHGWWLERFLLGRHHDHYHLVHHLRPALPSHHLARAHRLLLEDPAYCCWDGMWGGIFTRSRAGEETLLSYIRKYRDRPGVDPTAAPGVASHSFATALLARRVPALHEMPPPLQNPKLNLL